MPFESHGNHGKFYQLINMSAKKFQLKNIKSNSNFRNLSMTSNNIHFVKYYFSVFLKNEKNILNALKMR